MAINPLHELDFSVLQQCIHCGLCLPSCPTYLETGRERSSPRGRISLMKAVAEGKLSPTDLFAEEMSYCVGCLACTTACPAGVDYGQLLEHGRAAAEASPAASGISRRALRWLFLKQVFTHQSWLRGLARLMRLYQKSGCRTLLRRGGALRLLSKKWRALEPQLPLPSREFSDRLIATVELPAKARYRVLLLTGCVQDVLFADVNRATADVLLANDCEVHTPRAQGCCGSLHAHNGDLETARCLARRWLDRIDVNTFDAIVSNAAGCGSHLKHFSKLFADEPAYAKRAQRWDERVRDVSEWLIQIGFRAPAGGDKTFSQKITYHDACHLCHGQGITREPRVLLRAIPGVELVECAESTWCCGSAGIYSLTHPETANRLRDRKRGHLQGTGAEVVAMGNPGCALHLRDREGENSGQTIAHPVVLLARAYAREAPSFRESFDEKGAPIRGQL